MLLRPQHLSWWHHPPDAAADAAPPAHADAAAAKAAASSATTSGEVSGDACGETRGDVTVQFDLPPGAYATMALREVMRATPAPSPGHVRFEDAEGDG
jgi:tRNA(Glu) U13 pseudouridine synthase TruD